MAKKVEVDTVRDTYIKYFEWIHFRDRVQRRTAKIDCASLECLEDVLKDRERRLLNAKNDNWKFASWKSVDEFSIEIEYIKERIDSFYNSFRYVNI